MKILYILIIFLYLFLITCEENKLNNDPYEALLQLQSGKDANCFVILEASGTNHYLQFFLINDTVFFDVPLYSDIKEKFIDESDLIYAKKKANGLWEIYYLDENVISSLKKVLSRSYIKFDIVRNGYIEPTVFNQTDTTGWVTSIQGPLIIEKEYIQSFINLIFVEVYGLNKDTLLLSVQEGVFEP